MLCSATCAITQEQGHGLPCPYIGLGDLCGNGHAKDLSTNGRPAGRPYGWMTEEINGRRMRRPYSTQMSGLRFDSSPPGCLSPASILLPPDLKRVQESYQKGWRTISFEAKEGNIIRTLTSVRMADRGHTSTLCRGPLTAREGEVRYELLRAHHHDRRG